MSEHEIFRERIPPLDEIIDALPLAVVAYEWQLFLKRMNTKSFKESEAKVLLEQSLLEYYTGTKKIPQSPPQIYFHESEYEEEMIQCKVECLAYLHGEQKFFKSHLNNEHYLSDLATHQSTKREKSLEERNAQIEAIEKQLASLKSKSELISERHLHVRTTIFRELDEISSMVYAIKNNQSGLANFDIKSKLKYYRARLRYLENRISVYIEE